MNHHTTINGEATANNHSHSHSHNHNHRQNHSHNHNERHHRHRRHPQRRNNHFPHDRRHGVTPHHPTVAMAIWLLVRGGGTDAIGREPHLLSSSGRGNHGGRGRPSASSSSSSSGRPRSDVALRDSFPCEADSLTGTAVDSGAAVSASAGDTSSCDSGNGTAGGGNGHNASHGHSHASHGGNASVTSGDFPSFFPVSPRGGAVDAASKDVGGEADLDLSNVWNDDDYLDDMVDALIAGLEDSDATKGAAEGEKEGSVSILQESDQDSDADCPDPVDESEEESLDQSTTASIIESEGNVDEPVELELELELESEAENAAAVVSASNKPTQDSGTLSRQPPVPPSPPTTPIKTTKSTTTTKTISSLPPPTTPTNAYYRFLLRRGPKFHILASFSLLLTQWIYVYLPLLYRPIASLLLSCRIYDPNALWERDRQSAAFVSVRDRRRRTQDGIHARLKDKLWVSDANYGAFLSTSSAKRTGGTKKARKLMQKKEDEEAAVKLKRLYRLSGTERRMPTSLADVRYRYLSVGFRKRHHLGREYRVETPKRFMGETMEGSELGEDEAVLSDVEDGIDGESMESSSQSQSKNGMTSQQQRDVQSQPPTQRRRHQQQHQRRIKRKRINDWVVQSFAVHRGPPATNANVNVNVTNTKEIPLTLWNAVLGSPPPSSSTSSSSASSSNGANSILQAAWESRRAEQAVFWQTGRSADNDNNDHVHGDDRTKEGSSKRSGFDPQTGVDGTPRDDDSKNGRMGSGSSTGGTPSTASYSGSKMFQSVMSRVGSNGRILGAYPMDAPPIEECAHERGVLHLARRYGYGDWSRQDVAFDVDEDVGGDDDDSWGGGDLFSDPDMDKEDEEVEAEFLNAGLSSREKNTSNKITSGNRKRRTRRKKKLSSSSSTSSSQRAKALGMSGGGGGSFSVEIEKKNNPRVTFEFGVSSSTKRSTTKNSVPTTGQRKPSFVSSGTSTPLSSFKQNNERNAHEIRSQLHKRNATLFSSDIKIKAPMQVLNESKRRRKQHEE